VCWHGPEQGPFASYLERIMADAPYTETFEQGAWPELAYSDWKETCAALQLRLQIVGKVRLAQTPWLNHSWHVPFNVTARGLGTPLIPHRGGPFDMEFDFVDHVLTLRAASGECARVELAPTSTADFYRRIMSSLEGLGRASTIYAAPNEIADAIPFLDDVAQRPYDRDAVNRLWRILRRSHEVLSAFRTGFIGKCSPVHFFWGGMDLAVTRFSDRVAPPHPGGIPHLPDGVTREAYSHEVSSAGFWPGNGLDHAAFYAYAYPEPSTFRSAAVQPEAAYYHDALKEFILPYDAVRTAADPASTLMQFLQWTYDAVQWPPNLTRAIGRIGVPPES
jgi:hypothetical protein